MKVTSLFALRESLRQYLAAKLPQAEILAALPAARRPLRGEKPVLVIGVEGLRRSDAFLSPCSGLLLEVGLSLTVCHPDSSEECEAVTAALAELAADTGFPFHLLALGSAAVEYNRTIGAFLQKTLCTVCCLLSEGESA